MHVSHWFYYQWWTYTHFNEYDLRQLPVTWSGLTIEASMQDQPLAMRDFLSRPKAVELIDDVIAYVEQHVG